MTVGPSYNHASNRQSAQLCSTRCLIGLLSRSLDSEAQEGIEEAWRVEIERRTRELESGAVKSIPWAVVRERLARAPHG